MSSFNWLEAFPEVFAKGGFDVVVGNPPYIQLKKDNGRLGKLYKPLKLNTFMGTSDAYVLFYEVGCLLINDNGVLGYITSNTWMRSNFGKLLRKYLADYHIMLIKDNKGDQL